MTNKTFAIFSALVFVFLIVCLLTNVYATFKVWQAGYLL